MRSNRSSNPAHEHKDFKVIVALLDHIAAQRPNGGIIEEVVGFMSPVSGEWLDGTPLPSSWASWFFSKLHELGYFVSAVRLNNSIWSTSPRDRFLRSTCIPSECPKQAAVLHANHSVGAKL
jgi:hypothetical protein